MAGLGLRVTSISLFLICVGLSCIAFGIAVAGESDANADRPSILTIDHYLKHRSKAHSIKGQFVNLYVKERIDPELDDDSGGLKDRVILFVHGASTPIDAAFDLPYPGYSWMEYLAKAGFDVFAIDLTGYGRSTRPHFMSDPCNLREESKVELGLGPSLESCDPSYLGVMTGAQSDWSDMDRVVDFIREHRNVEKISMIGWSQGGPRIGGYVRQHPDKVDKIIFLAPAYRPDRGEDTLADFEDMPSVRARSRMNLNDGWDSQIGCSDQVDPSVRPVVWSSLTGSDPVGGTWGPGAVRSPLSRGFGWNASVAATTTTPVLMFAGDHDASITPDMVLRLYEDWGSDKKILVNLACASHMPQWEKSRHQLFNASLEWLLEGSVDGSKSGVMRLGD